MSLSQRIVDAVRLFESPGRLPGQVEIDLDEGGRIALALAEVGPVGLAFDRLEYQSGEGVDRSAESLRGWADRLAARTTYLMEPLVVVEHDLEAGAIDVRSKAPTVRNGRRAYYEVRLGRQGTLALSRVVFDEATRSREAVACPMTFETLDRLIEDIRDTSR
ncbi:MAG: hypothetical protein U0794_21180 [Isosphaeraceae bacterium]